LKSWSLTFATQMLFRRSGSELFDTFKNIILLRIFPLQNIYSWKMFRKLKWQIPGEPLTARYEYNWFQGRGPAVWETLHGHGGTQFSLLRLINKQGRIFTRKMTILWPSRKVFSVHQRLLSTRFYKQRRTVHVGGWYVFTQEIQALHQSVAVGVSLIQLCAAARTTCFAPAGFCGVKLSRSVELKVAAALYMGRPQNAEGAVSVLRVLLLSSRHLPLLRTVRVNLLSPTSLFVTAVLSHFRTSDCVVKIKYSSVVSACTEFVEKSPIDPPSIPSNIPPCLRRQSVFIILLCGRVQLKCDGTRWRTGGEVKGKIANGMGPHTTSEQGISSITTADAHASAAGSRLNWRPRRYKWTLPFRRKTKSRFCPCAITFQTQSNCI